MTQADEAEQDVPEVQSPEDMTAEQFTAAGRLLFGTDGWRGLMADELGIDVRKVRRWASGAHRMPRPIAQAVWERVQDRQEALTDLLATAPPDSPSDE